MARDICAREPSCQRTFRQRKTGRRKLYCSSRCRLIAWRERRMKLHPIYRKP